MVDMISKSAPGEEEKKCCLRPITDPFSSRLESLRVKLITARGVPPVVPSRAGILDDLASDQERKSFSSS